MAEVQILSANETSDGYRFDVAVDEAGHHTRHEVSLSAADYQRWSEEGASPQAVARRCVELLVERVQQDDLMERFDLREALQFYPAFEEEIHRRME